jgi:putative peptidoglycan lipid II flippase
VISPGRSAAPSASGSRASILVASGILASRIAGLVRQRVFSFYFGTSPEADAFNAAFRIPNILQNLLGEGVLSASFIPVYAKLRARDEHDARQRVAGAVLGVLAVVSALVVVAGVLLAPVLVDLIAPGFEGAKRDLTVQLVRILFPGAGLFVVSAWCLGVLNSHGKFLLSYASPVLWNAAMIAVLLVYGRTAALPSLAVFIAWGSVAGSALQVLVQWPAVHAVLGAWRLSLGRGLHHAREVYRNFVPALLGRGVTQLSAYLDAWIASFLVDGSVTILANAQLLYMLPVSLFAMSVSAAELPAMSGEPGEGEARLARVRERLDAGLRRIAFFVVPSAVGLIALGDVIGGLVYRGGAFDAADTRWLWATVAAAAVGLLGATLGRLYASTFYALGDARTPQRFAIVRVVLNATLGFGGALWLAPRLGLDPRANVVLLALASGIAAWVEFTLLQGGVRARVGGGQLPLIRFATLAGCALAAALVAWGVKLALAPRVTFVGEAIISLVFALVYGGATLGAGVPEARGLFRRLRRA